MTVKVAFLAEYLIALGTRGRLVDLDVQMHLRGKFKKTFQFMLFHQKNGSEKETNLKSQKMETPKSEDLEIQDFCFPGQ